MAANPALSSSGQGHQLPALYAGEVVALQREGLDLNIDGLRTSNGRCRSLHAPDLWKTGNGNSKLITRTVLHRWSARGVLFLTNLRLVFVAKQTDAASGQYYA